MTWGELLEYAESLDINEGAELNFNIEPGQTNFVINKMDESQTTWSIL